MQSSVWCICVFAIAVQHITANMQTAQDCLVDIVLLVDRSGSIVDPKLKNNPKNWDSVVEFLETFVKSYQIGKDATQIAMVTFNHNARVEFNLGATQKEMLSAIANIPKPQGRTKTAAAVMEAARILTGREARSSVSKVVIAVTDGNPTVSLNGKITVNDNTHTIEEELKRQEIYAEVEMMVKEQLQGRASATVLTLAIGQYVSEELMLMIAGKEENTFKVDNFDKLMSKVNFIKDQPCKTRVCNLDVALAVDTSGSVSEMPGAVDAMKTFLKALVSRLYQVNPTVRIALINFDNEAHLPHNLNNYRQQHMMSAIESLDPSRGWTATAAALKTANEMVFTGNENLGDRSTAPNVFVFVTDGLPTVMLNGEQVPEGDTNERRAAVMDEVMQQVDILKNGNTAIMSVIVKGNKGMDLQFLEDIADGNVIDVMEYQELINNLNTTVEAICSNAPNAISSTVRELEQKDNDIAYLEKLIKLLKKDI